MSKVLLLDFTAKKTLWIEQKQAENMMREQARRGVVLTSGTKPKP